jgi:hypothetical protein
VAAEVPWAVQVKRRGDSVRAEGPQAVREFVGALVVSGHRSGLYVTTAPRFSTAARTTALQGAASLAIDEITLLDRSGLAETLELRRVDDAWAQSAPRLTERLGAHDPVRRITAVSVVDGSMTVLGSNTNATDDGHT